MHSYHSKLRPAIAWTGGCRPLKPSQISREQASLQKYLFGEQVCTFRAYWHFEPEWEVLRIFFNRARYDAHATYRK